MIAMVTEELLEAHEQSLDEANGDGAGIATHQSGPSWGGVNMYIPTQDYNVYTCVIRGFQKLLFWGKHPNKNLAQFCSQILPPKHSRNLFKSNSRQDLIWSEKLLFFLKTGTSYLRF